MMEGLRRLFSDITARDALVALFDILIVYYAIYRILLLIKGTRAAQMLIGLVLIGAGFFAAEQFELATVSWLLDNFINYFIIIIIVVFQHDIRRGLVRIGQNLFAFGRTYEEKNVFEEVIHACEHLAKARIGAIMVFEREGDVSEFVDTGSIIDARVSRELLVSLFVPSRDNVLHDGAAIIKNLRVQQAGAVLPLSQNARLDPQLGTRHRAAIGVTEETDAVSVVVSEERGEISLCFHGNIAQNLDPVTLRKALLGLFYKEKKKKQRVADEAQAAAAAALAVAALAQGGVVVEGEPKAEREDTSSSPADKGREDDTPSLSPIRPAPPEAG
jgi:diadenylate cyclase